MRTGSAHAVDGIERALGRVAAASAQIHNHLPGFDAAQLFYGFAYGMLGGEAADNDCVGVVAVQPLHQAVAHMLASVVKTGTVQNAVGFDAVVVIGGVGQAAEQAVTLAMLHILAEMAVAFLQKARGRGAGKSCCKNRADDYRAGFPPARACRQKCFGS